MSARAGRGRNAAGRLHRIHRGVYAVGHPSLALHGRWMAAVMACGRGAVLSHVDAAALWGLCDPGGGRIHVTVGSRNGRGVRPGLAVHRSRLHSEDRAIEDRIPATSVARTLLDLAEVVDGCRLRRAWEKAYRRRLLDVRQITDLLGRSPGRRGLAPLGALLDYDPAPAADADSELERTFLDLVRAAGLASPAVGVLVEGFLVDCHWPAARLVVELDGYEFHSGREEFERDREKQATLRLAGYELLAFTYRQVTERPRAVVDAVSSLLARGARRAEGGLPGR